MGTEKYNLISVILIIAASFCVPYFLNKKKSWEKDAISEYKETENAKTITAMQKHQEESNRTMQGILINVERLSSETKDLNMRVARLESQNDN